MRAEYDYSKSRKNAYTKLLKQSVTIRLAAPTITYFKSLSAEFELPYKTLIGLYLRDCAWPQRKPNLRWRARRVGVAG